MVAQKGVKRKRYPKEQARKIYVRALTDGAVFLTPHIRVRMKERDFEMPDVLKVGATGRIDEEGVWDPTHESYKYLIKGKDCDRNDLHIAFAIRSDKRIILITGTRPKKGGRK